MPAAYRIIVDASIGLLFIKGLLLIPVTLHAFAQAYLGQARPGRRGGVMRRWVPRLRHGLSGCVDPQAP